MTERYANKLMQIMAELYVKRSTNCPFACTIMSFKLLIACILPSSNLISEFSGCVGKSIAKFANGHRESIVSCSFCPIYFRFIGTVFPACVVTGVYPFQ
jgi:hypothetical protein